MPAGRPPAALRVKAERTEAAATIAGGVPWAAGETKRIRDWHGGRDHVDYVAIGGDVTSDTQRHRGAETALVTAIGPAQVIAGAQAKAIGNSRRPCASPDPTC